MPAGLPRVPSTVFAAGLNHAGANEETLPAEGAVWHPGDITREVPQRLLHRLRTARRGRLLARLGEELFALVGEQTLGPAV